MFAGDCFILPDTDTFLVKMTRYCGTQAWYDEAIGLILQK
ncbi:hypothetical protein HMPREF0530_0225 [Lacticaseibacillus paracasei subsp. paracasei ATCC 25302 = DSM 5622 = JCM 8130]|nr:hypothetical protein HMPREF0530_0225 [Lacticaseibacillus paracasei subsp. paracasei ATCC 25302 = DSM 5622 = JCM 8130]